MFDLHSSFAFYFGSFLSFRVIYSCYWNLIEKGTQFRSNLYNFQSGILKFLEFISLASLSVFCEYVKFWISNSDICYAFFSTYKNQFKNEKKRVLLGNVFFLFSVKSKHEKNHNKYSIFKIRHIRRSPEELPRTLIFENYKFLIDWKFTHCLYSFLDSKKNKPLLIYPSRCSRDSKT